jgi:uncharacterized protein
LGDDLALNAQQVAGVQSNRELPVVWAVAKGSLINKAILVPSALAISAFAPWLITPLLMIGGAFLCFEGFEKISHRYLHAAEHEAHHAELTQALVDENVDLVALERDKIKGAVRTDFILSAEIIAITLGAVAGQPLLTQAGVMAGIALVMTVGVYAVVAGIVKLDDLGLHLSRKAGVLASLGRGILWAAPWLMKTLTVVGTAAMFLVGGGILVHGLPFLHHLVDALTAGLSEWPGLMAATAIDGAVGLAAGALALAGVSLVQKLRGRA